MSYALHCDRCTAVIRDDEQMASVVVSEGTVAGDDDLEVTRALDLCSDCMASYRERITASWLKNEVD